MLLLPPSGWDGQATWAFWFLCAFDPEGCHPPLLPCGLSLRLAVLLMFGTAWLLLAAKLDYCGCSLIERSWYSWKARCMWSLASRPLLESAAFVSWYCAMSVFA